MHSSVTFFVLSVVFLSSLIRSLPVRLTGGVGAISCSVGICMGFFSLLPFFIFLEGQSSKGFCLVLQSRHFLSSGSSFLFCVSRLSSFQMYGMTYSKSLHGMAGCMAAACICLVFPMSLFFPVCLAFFAWLVCSTDVFGMKSTKCISKKRKISYVLFCCV